MFIWGVIGATIAVISIVAGLPWGAAGVAAGYAITDLCLSTPLMFWYIGRKGPVGMRDIYRTIAPAMFAAACSLVALLLCRQWLAISPYLAVRLILAGGLTLAVSFLVFGLLPGGRLAIKNFCAAVVLLKRGRESIA
jgi:PST family polysaccharide transporter